MLVSSSADKCSAGYSPNPTADVTATKSNLCYTACH